MKMRAGGPAGRADISDHLSLADLGALADARGHPAHMAVAGLITVGVLNFDQIAIAAGLAGKGDRSGAGGIDLGAGRRGEIDALMGLPALLDRVEPASEARGNAHRIDRRAHQELFHALPVCIEIVGSAFTVLEAEQGAGLAAIGDGGVMDTARLGLARLSVQIGRVQKFECVAAADLALEVDRIGQDLDQIDDDPVRHAQIMSRGEQAGFDGALDPHETLVQLQRHGPRFIAGVLGTADQHLLVDRRLDPQFHEIGGGRPRHAGVGIGGHDLRIGRKTGSHRDGRAGRRLGAGQEGHLDRLTGLEAARVEHRPQGVDQGRSFGLIGTGVQKHAHQRAAARHGDGHGLGACRRFNRRQADGLRHAPGAKRRAQHGGGGVAAVG